MNLDILLAAPAIIQIHAFAAMLALLLGVIQLIAPKGTLPHRTIGLIWIVLMSGVTITSIFIQREVGPDDPFLARFSWIHVLTVTTGLALILGTARLIIGGPKLKRHALPFIITFIGGLIIAGFFAFMPGRMMHDVLFDKCLSNLSQDVCSASTLPDDLN